VLSAIGAAVFAVALRDRKDGEGHGVPGGVTPMVVLAGCGRCEILALTFVGSKVWAGSTRRPPIRNSLQIDVQARQFAFYFPYPRGGRPVRFGAPGADRTKRAATSSGWIRPTIHGARRHRRPPRIPVNRPSCLTLRAKDVNQLYVPELRIQQDFVPGLVIPLHSPPRITGSTRSWCTQLCDWGTTTCARMSR